MSRIREASSGTWEAALVGREVVGIQYAHSDEVTLQLDDGAELVVDAELDCCAYGVIETQDVVGGRIMSVTTDSTSSTEVDDWDSRPSNEPDSVYKIFLMNNGFPGQGTITVNSYEGSGYYGSGYTISVRRPEGAAE